MNFRDIGGYPTASGQRVRVGRVFRSATLGGMTERDRQVLSRLGVRLIVDLRTRAEREVDPYPWVDEHHIEHWTRDYEMSAGNLTAVLARSPPTPGRARETMIALYRELAFEQAPAIRELFARIACGHLPLVVNCSAGKDRTGVTAALLLLLLGVPRDTVYEDYRLTNELMDWTRLAVRRAPSQSSFRLPPEERAPLYAADSAYLAAALSEIERRYDSIDGFARDVLELHEADVIALRRELLEERRPIAGGHSTMDWEHR